MKKIIVIVGATASGKSALALKLAQDLKTEIISADAFQIYKELNVGVNKPAQEALNLIKHHFIGSHSIYDEFDIKIFQDECVPVLEDLINRTKTAIICGGSNLYIDAVIKGYNLDKSHSREEITHFDNWSYDEIYQYVVDRDPDEASKLNYENKKRVIRAAQIIFDTDQPKSKLDNQVNNYVYDTFIVETLLERDILHSIINKRTDEMFDNGWIEEVQSLYSSDNTIINLKAFQAIGYRQIAESFINNIDIDRELIKQGTRQLAKRQMTWNRNRYKDINRFDPLNDDYSTLLNKIKEFLN
ncbi:MAG: tRNA (adenosine(37)-N6)-dimethylallyltransferase MiaA [Mycoplasma sp.]